MRYFYTIFFVVAVAVVLCGAVLFWPFDSASPVSVAPKDRLSEEVALEPIVLREQGITFSDGTETTFRLAEPFALSVAAEDLGKARFMAFSPDGRLFVPDLVNMNLSHEGKLFVLDDFNEETHEFETKHTYLSGLRGPNSVAFYTDKDGQDWLYLALTKNLLRYPYQAGDTKPSGPPEVVYEFPNKQSPGEVSVVWHITRTLLFHDDQLYIAIGSGCNSCEHLEGDLRAMIMVMNPDGTNPRKYADGLRNTVGLTWAKDAVYVTANGVDHLGVDRPDETMYRVIEGKHYGWPFCYESEGVVYEDTTSVWDEPIACTEVPRSLASFPPRSAPLGITFFEDAHAVLKNTFLVSLHGSFEPEHQRGYGIVRVTPEGDVETFMDGFQKGDVSRVARPVDVLQRDENSFFFTDDFGGRIYYVYVP